MEMNELIDQLKEKVDQCKEKGKFFNKPLFDDESIIVTEKENPSSESVILNYTYRIVNPGKGTIVIDAISKDKSRTFDVRPDVTTICVRCSGFEDASSYDFTDGWEEGLHF